MRTTLPPITFPSLEMRGQKTVLSALASKYAPYLTVPQVTRLLNFRAAVWSAYGEH